MSGMIIPPGRRAGPRGLHLIPGGQTVNSGDHQILAPVWANAQGTPEYCAILNTNTVTDMQVTEYQRFDHEWVHHGTLARDAFFAIGVSASAQANITAFAMDSPGTSTKRVLFIATNNAANSPDTFEMYSVDLSDGEALAATAVTIAGDNQPTDTDTMGTCSIPLSSTRVMTIFEDDAHFADITGDDTGFTFTYDDAKVTAIDTSIAVTGTPSSLYSGILVGDQVMLMRSTTTLGVVRQSLWELTTAAALTKEVLDFQTGMEAMNATSYPSAAWAIDGSFAVANPVVSQLDRPAGYIASTFPLGLLTANS